MVAMDYIEPEEDGNVKAGLIDGNVLHAVDLLRVRYP